MTVPNLDYEQAAWSQGFNLVVGIDEVGRGAWAGPVVAAAVQLRQKDISQTDLPLLLRDSKKLSPRQRLQVVEEIKQIAQKISIGQADVEEINQIGIGQANFLAMSRALDGFELPPDFILIDGYPHPQIDRLQQKAIIKGDSIVASIAAASIIAKVHRDRLMVELATHYPHYGIEKHMGYGTQAHRQAILAHGLSPIHRKNYKLKFLTTA